MKKQVMLIVIAIVGITATTVNAEVLNIYLLAGQSNMEGQAYTYDSEATANWNIPTLEFLLSGTTAATAYRAAMPYGFEDSLDSSWLNPRDDVWAVHYNSSNGTVKNVLPTNDPADMVSGIQPLQPGFGVGTNFGSMFGAELGMGIRLGDAMQSPVFMFKSSMGGTTLGNDWRPPTAVAARGGIVGPNYTNTMNRLIEFLDALDADLADDNVLNGYGNATGYVVAGVFWFQGWNEMYNDSPYTKEQLQAEYADNLRDLIYSIRAADTRIPNDLPLIIGESADQNATLNIARQAAVDQLNSELPGSAVFFDTDNMKDTNWGNNELGAPFSTNWGSHYHARAENYLEIGWKAAGAVLDNGYYLDDQTPLQLPVVGITDANSTSTVSLYGAITDNADQVIVYWGTEDQGAVSTGWSGSEDLGDWTGGAGQVPVTLTGLQPDTTYVFRYWATSTSLSDDAWSRAGEVKTDFAAGQAPSDLIANPISFAQIDLTWSEDINTESGFVLRRADDADFTVGVVDFVIPAANAASYSDKSVTAGLTYYYKVAASNAYGLSDFSELVSIRVPEIPEPQTPVITAYYDFEANGPLDDPCSPPYDPNDPLYDPLSHLTDKAGIFADDLKDYDPNEAHEPWSSDVPEMTDSTTSASFNGDRALFTDAFTTDLGPDSNAYTIMFWVKGSDLDQENNNTRLMTSRVLPTNSGTGENTWQIEGFGNNGSNGDNMDLRTYNGMNWIQTDDAKLGSIGALANTGQQAVWHHVVFIVANSGDPADAGAYTETYFDGVSLGKKSKDSSWDGYDIANHKGQLIIGSTSETGADRDFTGLLDDVALFSGIVSADDIAAIAAGTLSPADFIGEDTDPPTPDPMRFVSAPAATSDSAITMTAAEATDYNGVQYYFTCTAGGGNDSDWQDSPEYTDTGLEPGTTYTYTVKARDKSENLNETAASEEKSATTDAPDSDAPAPDPMTWASAPASAGINSVTMTATTAIDPSGVEYYFTCTSGGGNDSGWQDSPEYTDTGLIPGTSYTYTVMARDKSALQNATAPSDAASATPRYEGDAFVTVFYDFEPDSPLDDPAGDFADDLTGYNPAWSIEVPGVLTSSTQSASFNGDTALFTGAHSSDLGPGSDAYTIMFWIKASDANQENNNTRLITTRTKPDGGSASIPSWQIEGFGNNGSNGTKMDLRASNGEKNMFALDAASGDIGALANTGQEEVWHHVAFVFANSGHPDGSGNAYSETFFDGQSVGLQDQYHIHESWNGFDIANPDGQLIIGSTGETGGGRDFTGLLDDVALFSGVVAAEDIAAIAAGTLSPGLLTGTKDTDLTGEGDVNLADFAIFARNWLRTDCTEPDSCEGSDFNGDGSVNETDLAKFVADWLK